MPTRHNLDHYELHDLVRQFGAEKLQAAPAEAAEAQRRHSQYHAELLANQHKYLDCADWTETLFYEIGAEVENVRAAWHSGLARCGLEALDQAHDGLFRFYQRRSWYQEGNDAFGAQARQTEALSGPTSAGATPQQKNQCLRLHAMALGRQGVFCFYLGQHDKSRQLPQRSPGLLREPGDLSELGHFLVRSAMLARDAGDAAEARHMLHESLSVSRSVGNQPQVAGTLRLLAYLEGQAEDFSQAAVHLDEALALGRSTGDTWSIAATLTSNGLVRYLAGDVQPATWLRRGATSRARRA